MQTKNVPFVERDIEKNAFYRADYKKLGGGPGVPSKVFGQKTMRGFSTCALDQHNTDFLAALGSRNR